MGKMFNKSKTMPHIDLDKAIIKCHYYPPSNEALSMGNRKKTTFASINNEAIKEQIDAGILTSVRTEEGLRNLNKDSKGKVEVKLKDMRKNVGTAAEGAGSYEYDNKFFKYEGQWRNGKKHGSGKLVFLDKSYYEGTFHSGEIEGFGKRFFAATGCNYQGQFHKGELHGKGRMLWPDGSIYEGHWEKNQKQGFGMMKSVKENCLYKGNYHDNKRHGQGTMIYPKGDVYEGDWHMDMRQGEGDMRFTDGTVYEGQFVDDKFNGEGMMRHCSGLIYDGQWIHGEPAVLPDKLVIIHPTDKEVLDIVQGQPFDIQVKCVNNDGELIEVDNRRELRITAGYKHKKAKKGTALFDLIEEYEEKPMSTPYYDVLQYPLTDFLLEEDEPEVEQPDELKEENEDIQEEEALGKTDDCTGSCRGTLVSRQSSVSLTNTLDEMDENAETPQIEQTPDTMLPVDSQSMPETPMSGLTSVTPGILLDVEKDSCPLPPPIANRRTDRGECEWKNIMLPQAPPRFPPFVALDEEDRKTRARQQKQVEAKRLNRIAHDERFARLGEYIIMVHDVTHPQFMGKTVEPAFILVKLRKPKREKKPKEDKQKWDTTKHIAESMVRS